MKWRRINRITSPQHLHSECNQLRIAVLTTRDMEHWWWLSSTGPGITKPKCWRCHKSCVDWFFVTKVIIYWWLLMIIYKLPRYHRICTISIPQVILPTISYNDLRICPHSMLKLVLIIWSLLSKPLYIVSVFKVNSWDARGSQNFNSIFYDSGKAYIYINNMISYINNSSIYLLYT